MTNVDAQKRGYIAHFVRDDQGSSKPHVLCHPLKLAKLRL